MCCSTDYMQYYTVYGISQISITEYRGRMHDAVLS